MNLRNNILILIASVVVVVIIWVYVPKSLIDVTAHWVGTIVIILLIVAIIEEIINYGKNS